MDELIDTGVYELLIQARALAPEPVWLAFLDPVSYAVAWTEEMVLPALAMVEEALADGLAVAGFVTYEAAGGFDPALRAHEDWDLLVRLAGRGLPFASTPTPVAVYRRHANSNSCNGRRMLQTALAVLDKASGQHHNCAECRTRIRRARRAFRFLFVRDTLWAELRSRPGPAKLWNMVRFVAAAQWRDMAFLPMLLWLASKKGWRTITGRG